MVSSLVVVLVLGLMQLALVLHVRNTLVDSAGEGARVAALADQPLSAGVDRTRELLTTSLSSGYARDVRARIVRQDGLEIVVVTVVSPLPLVGLLGPSGTLTVTGRAVSEEL